MPVQAGDHRRGKIHLAGEGSRTREARSGPVDWNRDHERRREEFS
jgi:hypothetical protein